jgi:uncharacterized protein
MNSQERDVISGIFDRLKSVADAPRDPEAERFIAELVARQPYAPYAMAQAVYVQEQALREINDKVRDLEAQLKSGGGQAGSFLGSLFGVGTSEQAPTPTQPSRASVPQAGIGTAPQYGTSPGQGEPQQFPPAGQPPGCGGFLQGALAAAAGVAGGALLYQGLKGLFGSGEAQQSAHRLGDTGRSSDDRSSSFGDPDNFLRSASLPQDDESTGGDDDEIDLDLGESDD